jgi:hypothetical protein
MATTELVSSPTLDKRLLRMARRSPNEIEAETGIPASEVAERLTRLLDQRNWRDDLLEERLLLTEVGELIYDLRQRMQGAEDTEAYVALARVLTTNVRTMLDQIERRRKVVDADLSKVTEAQAKLMAMAFSIASEKAELDLRKKYPEIPQEAVHLALQQGLADAMTMVGRETE